MKIAIGYLPYRSNKGTALVSQNRQFMWSKSRTVIYPVIMASLATKLKKYGNEVLWLDGIAENLTIEEYVNRLYYFKADLLIVETKTPVMHQTWNIINSIKGLIPECKIILYGDHVTALPEESYKNCFVDKILIGGNIDREEYIVGNNIKDVIIDRELTKWELYSKRNGNFEKIPGAYTQFSRDCDHGKCTFCSWTTLFPKYSVCSTDHAMEEIENLVSLGAKEIFDDSGTFPTGIWMNEFCEKLIKFNERNKKYAITMGCNMRSGILQRKDWELLKRSGFRLCLLGLESANDFTLERLNKKFSVRDIISSSLLASRAGLSVHLTAMVGFPWETERDAWKTIELSRDLFKKGYAKTIQATICIPYPGTPLFKEAEEKEWLLTKDWSKFDQSQAIMKVDYNPVKLCKDIYKSCITASYILRTVFSEKPSTIVRYSKYLWNHLK
jgi:anaerobic magnesium-protoporphyrin IX monomethyl ester cyclase